MKRHLRPFCRSHAFALRRPCLGAMLPVGDKTEQKCWPRSVSLGGISNLKMGDEYVANKKKNANKFFCRLQNGEDKIRSRQLKTKRLLKINAKGCGNILRMLQTQSDSSPCTYAKKRGCSEKKTTVKSQTVCTRAILWRTRRTQVLVSSLN